MKEQNINQCIFAATLREELDLLVCDNAEATKGFVGWREHCLSDWIVVSADCCFVVVAFGGEDSVMVAKKINDVSLKPATG